MFLSVTLQCVWRHPDQYYHPDRYYQSPFFDTDNIILWDHKKCWQYWINDRIFNKNKIYDLRNKSELWVFWCDIKIDSFQNGGHFLCGLFFKIRFMISIKNRHIKMVYTLIHLCYCIIHHWLLLWSLNIFKILKLIYNIWYLELLFFWHHDNAKVGVNHQSINHVLYPTALNKMKSLELWNILEWIHE